MVEKSYKKFTSDITFTDDTYVIIGSGIGGLSTAVFLAKSGKKVVVLEQHYTPGGFTHTFKRRKGLVWDVGVHYVGNMEEDSGLRRIFNYLSDNKLKWDPMGDPYDVAYIGDRKFEFVGGKENFRQKFYEYFPDDTLAIDKYLELLQKSTKKNLMYFAQKAFPGLLSITLGPIFRRMQRSLSERTTYEVLSSITDNQELIAVLCAQCGNYGLSPKESSFASHCIVINHFMEGGHYPRGGANRIHETIIDNLESLGVQVFIKAKVDKIITSKRSVKGIVINGKEHACKRVISNAGAHNTFQHLLAPKTIRKKHIALKEIKPSTCHLCLYIGLNKSDAALKLPKYNIWWYADKDTDRILNDKNNLSKDQLSFAYISFPSAKDSLWSSEHPDTATIQLIGRAWYEDFSKFENEPWLNRGETYNQIKDNFKNKGLSLLKELYPHLEDHIIHAEVSTPVSTRKFSNYSKGEIYGVTHAPDRYKSRALRPRTHIKGLYLTGQDITLVGVGGAMASGILTAATIIKWNMSKQFKEISAKY
ncbi:phytoene desaturase family protein [Aquimarina sp. 2201CG14-23]|uniref:phytoene desaturase family protein n=1 Tax=Aquimarina mycalae TaxID=3040073 RepID=UPI002477D156|nr:NAD(P)/FAD-dependent oxidoreductase [Aquimarina sp. 2201CG14-23]MDH7444447.1 NAD(P)/FAD-dependent oxidoreductase [Aquimarina sp. 2201CG14-23]